MKIAGKEGQRNGVVDSVVRMDVKQLVVGYVNKNEEYMWKRIKHQLVQTIAKCGEKIKPVSKQGIEDYIYGYLKQLLTWLSHHHHQHINPTARTEELNRKLQDITKLATEAQQRVKRRDEKISKMEKLINAFAEKLKEKVIQYNPPKSKQTKDAHTQTAQNYSYSNPHFTFLLKLLKQINSNKEQEYKTTICSLAEQLKQEKKLKSYYLLLSTQGFSSLQQKDNQIKSLRMKLEQRNSQIFSNLISFLVMKERDSKGRLTKAQQKIKKMKEAQKGMRFLIDCYAQEFSSLQKKLVQIEGKLVGKEKQLLALSEEKRLLKAEEKKQQQVQRLYENKISSARLCYLQRVKVIGQAHKYQTQILNKRIQMLMQQLESAKRIRCQVYQTSCAYSQFYVPAKEINQFGAQTQTVEEDDQNEKQEQPVSDSSEESSYVYECDTGTQYDFQPAPQDLPPFPQAINRRNLQQNHSQNNEQIQKLREQLELMKKQELITLKQLENLKIQYCGVKFELGQVRHRLINYLEDDHQIQVLHDPSKDNSKIVRQLELSISQLQNENFQLRRNNEELLETIQYANSLFSCEPVQKQQKHCRLHLKNKLGYNFTETTGSHSYDRSEKSQKSDKQQDYYAIVSNYEAKCQTEDEDHKSQDSNEAYDNGSELQTKENSSNSSFGGAIARLLAEFISSESKEDHKMRAFTTLIELLAPDPELTEKFNKYVKLRGIKNKVAEGWSSNESMQKTGLKDKLYRFFTQN